VHRSKAGHSALLQKRRATSLIALQIATDYLDPRQRWLDLERIGDKP
jgi:hypothetical protein